MKVTIFIFMTFVQRKITYRLYPNTKQLASLEETHTLHCRVANTLLEEHKRRYEMKEPSFNFSAMCKEITFWRGFADSLSSLNAQSLQVTAKRASLAFEAFFRRVKLGQTAGYPRFKSRNRFTGWGYKTHGDGWKLLQEHSALKHGKGYAGTEYGAVRLSGTGTVSMRGRGRFAGTPKTAEVIRKKDKWFLSVTFNVDENAVKRVGGHESVAFDWGIKELLTTVVGDALTGPVKAVNNPRWLKTKLVRIKELQHGISLLEEAAKKSSGKTTKFPVNVKLFNLYARLRKLHGQIARQRQDFYHQLTAAMVKRFGFIVTEQLSTKNMTRSPQPKKAEDGTFLPNGAAAKAGLNRAILDGAPASMLQKFRYKAEEAGSEWLELTTKKLKPSQRCCQCGGTQKMSLKKRTYQCTCGNVMDRDENATRTMLRYAQVGSWWETKNQAGTAWTDVGLNPS
jgi:putative transposase